MSLTTSILAKLVQPSSWAGLAVLFQAIGWNVSDDLMKTIVQVASGVAALAAFFLNEKAAKPNA